MSQEGFDQLTTLTDSRYRLSMIVARRAAQLKAGIPSVLTADEYPKTRNTVTIAMKELATTTSVRWGDELPSAEELREIIGTEQRKEPATYSVSRGSKDGRRMKLAEESLRQEKYDSRDGGKLNHRYREDNGRYMSTSTYDDYSEESSPD